MKFLWPMAAWLFALALPIIVLYLIRQRLRIKSVTTLLFWENLAPKVHNQPLWRKLRRLISLLLQLLLLSLIILAVLRPVPVGQSSAKRSIILVLDPTVTMGAQLGTGTRWQEAVRLAVRQIDSMGFGDEATVILAGDPPKILSPWTTRKGDLRECIEQAHLSANVTDIRSTLRLAQNLVVTHPGATIELISDTVWSVAPEKDSLAHLKLDRIGADAVNSGITLFSARELSSAAGEYQLAIKIEQNTGAPINGELSVSRNGQLMDVLPVTVAPGQPWQKFWRGQSMEGVSFEAKWKPQGKDDFALDEQAVASLDPVHEVNVTLVSQPNPFLEVALASQTLVKSQRVWPAPATIKANLVIFNDTMPPDNFSGKNVVLINPPQSGFWGEKVGAIDKPLVTDVDKDSALMRFTSLSDVQLHTATEFKPVPGAHVYAEAFGKPLIFGHWEAEPRWLVIAFDLNQSDFVFRTSFPILAANLVQSLRPEAIDRGEHVPGPVATQLKAMAPANVEAIVEKKATALAWFMALPLWWWVAGGALLLVLVEWSFYTRRVTE